MSSRISPQDVLNALRAVKDPDLGRDIVTLGFIKELEVGDNRVSFALQLTTPACPVRDQLVAQARAAVMALGVADVEVRLVAPAPARAPGRSLIPQVKYTIAVASGKGGVGKSTVAANLAVALQPRGRQSGPDGYRRLRAQRAHPDGRKRSAVRGGGQNRAPRRVRRQDHVHGVFPAQGRSRHLARPHAAQDHPAISRRRALGRTRLPHHGYAAGHGRHPVEPFARPFRSRAR